MSIFNLEQPNASNIRSFNRYGYEKSHAVAVIVDGPFPNANKFSDWEEFPEWTVFVSDEYGDEIGKVYHCRSYKKATSLGLKMSEDRNLEYINEASRSF